MKASDAATVFALTDRELWLVTASAEGRRGGLIATYVSRASLTAQVPRVLVGLAVYHHTRQLIETSSALAMHLFGEEQLDWVWRFGLHSGRDADKLAGLNAQEGQTGSPLLTEALAWLDCRVEARVETGDRTVYLAEIVEARVQRPGVPLTVKRVLQLAGADRMAELNEQEQRDGAADVALIGAWRQDRSG